MSAGTARDKSHWNEIYVPQLARWTYYLLKIKNAVGEQNSLNCLFCKQKKEGGSSV